MDANPVPELRPPADLRPAQLGIVLTGRVILGHVSATLADLADRGFLGLGEAHADWVLTDRRAEAAAAAGPLLDFEATLLDGLFGSSSLVRLSDLGEGIVPWLNKMRSQVRSDAIRQGRLRRWRRDARTPRGTHLLSQIRDFRLDVRAAAAAGQPPRDHHRGSGHDQGRGGSAGAYGGADAGGGSYGGGGLGPGSHIGGGSAGWF